MTVSFNYQRTGLDNHLMQRRIVVLAIAIVVVLVAAISGYVYLTSLSPNNGGTSHVTMIPIPQWSYIEPKGFNITYFQEYFASGPYPYPVNKTVTVGVNNTIEWVNQDTQAHTATAIVGPQGASLFNSGLILPGKTFSVTLTVPGTYRYACAWHNWLAGQIIVKSA